MTERTLAVEYLARVEGEGSLRLRIHDRSVEEVELRIFEPPRYFESFLRGRDYREAPDITARICGICPVAYQMSACHALERGLGLTLPEPLRELRRLLYCGEWIESHALHVYLLHAPDFFGVPDAVGLAKVDPAAVRRGLALKKAGNRILEGLGGRAIHPVNVRVGGFYRVPSREEAEALRREVVAAIPLAEETVRFVAALTFPEVEEEYDFVALRPPSEYPMNDGPLAASDGLELPQERFEEEFDERQVGHSNALQCVRRATGRPYLVGPMARFALNPERLGPRAKELARSIGLSAPERNPHRSIVVRALEVLTALEDAERILEAYRPTPVPFVEAPVPLGGFTGAAVTEAPRGILYHRYRVDAAGRILEAKIVPPTSQNQARIELDLRHLAERSIDLPDEALSLACERAVRNHDPCISCATHFLTLSVERS